MPSNKKLDQGKAIFSLPPVETDRLMEEINILRLEGSLFCFDPREAKRRGGKISLTDARKQPLSIEIHPAYGQPSVLAYRVLQAIFLKLTDEGCAVTGEGCCEYPESVSFSQRELATMAGRSWGGKTSKELYDAIMQLQSTRVIGSLYDKGCDTWQLAAFVVVPSTYFAGRGDTITRCTVRLAREVVASVNRRHVAFFNLHRLASLETLGLVLYKRVFFHLSNLNTEHKQPTALAFTKDYAMICREWLGGLKPQRYKADIVKQLGRHLDALKASSLVRRYAIEKNAADDGFNLTFYPGRGFFEDYRLYYLDREQPRLRFRAVADQAAIQRPLELVAYFHRRLGRTQNRFAEHETAYADELLMSYSEAELRQLINYAIERAATTNFEMLYFGALKQYLAAWQTDMAHRKERADRQARIDACPACDAHGMLKLRVRGTDQSSVRPCPHDLKLIAQIETTLSAEREAPS